MNISYFLTINHKKTNNFYHSFFNHSPLTKNPAPQVYISLVLISICPQPSYFLPVKSYYSSHYFINVND